MDLDKIKQLIDAMAKSDLADLELIENGWTLRLSRTPKQGANSPRTSQTTPKRFAPTTDAASTVVRSANLEVSAPLSGVVYLCPAPDKPPFVSVGQTIKAGTPVCLVEAMKVFNEVRAETDGVVEAILVASGHEIDAGQPLLRLVRTAA